jgi:hypothetical protein
MSSADTPHGELTDHEMCAIFGHRFKLIGRTADGKGVRQCRRCKHTHPTHPNWTPTRPGRTETR